MSTENIKNKQIGEAETSQREAVMKRLRELLRQQCKNYHKYITALEKQENLINTGGDIFMEQLLASIDLEEQIFEDIISVQKVIDPLDDMYRKLIPCQQDDVSALENKLEDLKNRAMILSTYNKELIQNCITEIHSKIDALKNNPFISSRQAIYKNSNSALYLDIEG